MNSSWIVGGNIAGNEFDRSKMGQVLINSNDEIICRKFSDKKEVIPLKELISVNILREETRTGGGVGGAAAGGALGFLIAGPLGTVVGAGIGRNKRGEDKTTISLVFRSGDSLIVELKDLSLLATFQKWHALNQTARTDSPSTPPADANPETMASKDKPGNVEKSPSVPKALKGRSNKKVDLPGNDTLEEWQKKAKDQGSVGTHCYSIIEEYVSQYNTYKWRNYDKLISNKNELKQVVQLASSHVGHTVNSINSHLKRLKEIAVERKSMRVREDFVLGEIAELEEKLQGWQFFGSEKRTRNKITSLKRDIENLHNSLDSLNKNEENIKRLLGKFSDIGNLEEFGSTARTYLKEILSDKAIAESWKEASNDKQLSKQQMQGIYNKANKNRKS